MKRSGTPALLVALISLIGAPTFARADSGSADAIRSQIQLVLEQRHPTDTPEWWKALGPKAPSVIVSMFQNSSHVYHRLRLVQALSYYDDPAATALLESQAASADDDVIRDAAIRALGLSQGARAEDFLSQFLASQDPQTRLATGQAFKRIADDGDSRARDLLGQFLASEKTAWVRNRVEHEPLVPIAGPLAILPGEDPPLSGDFTGHWSGYWIEPAASYRTGSPSSAMDSLPVTLDLMVGKGGGGKLAGTLQLKGKTWNLEHVLGKDMRFNGVIAPVADAGGAVGKAVAPGAHPPVPVAVDAELVRKDSVLVIHAVIPDSMATLVVRRESAAAQAVSPAAAPAAARASSTTPAPGLGGGR